MKMPGMDQMFTLANLQQSSKKEVNTSASSQLSAHRVHSHVSGHFVQFFSTLVDFFPLAPRRA